MDVRIDIHPLKTANTMMKERTQPSLDAKELPAPKMTPVYSKTQQWVIGIACITFFPLVYLIGWWITQWLK